MSKNKKEQEFQSKLIEELEKLFPKGEKDSFGKKLPCRSKALAFAGMACVFFRQALNEPEECSHSFNDLAFIGYKTLKVLCNRCGKTLLNEPEEISNQEARGKVKWQEDKPKRIEEISWADFYKTDSMNGEWTNLYLNKINQCIRAINRLLDNQK